MKKMLLPIGLFIITAMGGYTYYDFNHTIEVTRTDVNKVYLVDGEVCHEEDLGYQVAGEIHDEFERVEGLAKYHGLEAAPETVTVNTCTSDDRSFLIAMNLLTLSVGVLFICMAKEE